MQKYFATLGLLLHILLLLTLIFLSVYESLRAIFGFLLLLSILITAPMPLLMCLIYNSFLPYYPPLVEAS